MAQRFEFRLHIIGPDMAQVLVIPAGGITIGRQPGNEPVLQHQRVSRQHARVECGATGCKITDLGSANGTRVNGKRLEPNVPASLSPGDVIEIADYKLTLEQVPVEAEPGPAAPTPPVNAPRPMPETPRAAGPPPPTTPPLSPPEGKTAPGPDDLVPPGLSIFSRRLIGYLPACYQPSQFDEESEASQQTPISFLARFIGIFESIWTPIEWTVDHFDLYLHPATAPADFLPWLANWFYITLDSSWSEAQRRALLCEAHWIYARRGTCRALRRVLEIYTGLCPDPDGPPKIEIIDTGPNQAPFTFTVKLPVSQRAVRRELLEAIIDANKPAYASYQLEFTR